MELHCGILSWLKYRILIKKSHIFSVHFIYLFIFACLRYFSILVTTLIFLLSSPLLSSHCSGRDGLYYHFFLSESWNNPECYCCCCSHHPPGLSSFCDVSVCVVVVCHSLCLPVHRDSQIGIRQAKFFFIPVPAFLHFNHLFDDKLPLNYLCLQLKGS